MSVGIMENIDLVTGHIRSRLIAEGKDPTGRVLEFLKDAEGKNYYFEDAENFWRVYRFIPNSVTFDKVEDPALLERAGEAFGLFQKQLSDLPLEQLKNTLPGFHKTPRRMENFFAAAEEDAMGRRSEIEEELKIIRENEAIWSQLEAQKNAGVLPLRVTHNDTKYNNVLIDRTTGEAVCVIDLDTVSPGLCAFDFGDAIRFSANTAAEDEKDLSKVRLDLGLYEAFARGFIRCSRQFLFPAELESLAIGAITMTFELSARFLEDYLRGDRYFRTHRPGHNLDRGRCQLKLALDMKEKLKEMQRIDQKYAAEN